MISGEIRGRADMENAPLKRRHLVEFPVQQVVKLRRRADHFFVPAGDHLV
jgi:hypothetical protein